MADSGNEEDGTLAKKPNGFKDFADKTKASWNKIPMGFRVAIVITAFVGLSALLGLAFASGSKKPTAKTSAMVKRLVREANLLLRKAGQNRDPVLALSEACYAVDRLQVAVELVGEEEAQKQTGVDVRELTFYAQELQNSALQNVYDKCPGVDVMDVARPVQEESTAKKRKKNRNGARLSKETYLPPR